MDAWRWEQIAEWKSYRFRINLMRIFKKSIFSKAAHFQKPHAEGCGKRLLPV
jgi:hypothetical protein